MNVIQTIHAVASDLAAEGVGKGQTNKAQGYKFRGIDDVYTALASKLSKHGLVIVPTVTNRTVTERTNDKGTVIFSVIVTVSYQLLAMDGSALTAVMVGEAMDSGDKATNKALSAAYKYLAFQLFCIPVEGQADADSDTHVVSTRMISESQHAALIELMTKLEMKVGPLLAHYKVASVQDMTFEMAEHAVAALTNRYARQYAQEAAQEQESKP